MAPKKKKATQQHGGPGVSTGPPESTGGPGVSTGPSEALKLHFGDNDAQCLSELLCQMEKEKEKEKREREERKRREKYKRER